MAELTQPRWSVSAVLWISVLTIMASFQAWRGAWVDAIVFYALVTVLIIDRLSHGQIRLIKQPLIVSRSVMLVIGAVLAAALILAPRHGLFDLIVMIVVAVAVLLVAWQPQPEGRQLPHKSYARSALAWSVLAVALCVWEALAFIFSVNMPHGDLYPTISVLLDPFVENFWGRIFFVGLWVAGGLGLLGVWTKK